MITIIGAGPSGCYAAYLLAKAGKEVKVFEEHKKIGKPVQCAGIVTSSIKDIIEIKKSAIINRIKTARIYAPNNKFIEINLKNENLILDRAEFDRYLTEKAVDKGAKIYLNHRLIKINNKFILIKDIKNKKLKKFYFNNKNNNEFSIEKNQYKKSNNKKLIKNISIKKKLIKNNKIDYNNDFFNNNGKLINENNFNGNLINGKVTHLIGADGPLSIVSKYLNPNLKKEFWIGAQARLKLKNQNIVEFYPYLGTFAWVVPENKDIARIGVISKTNPNSCLNKFLRLKNINKNKIIEMQGGLIPVYNKKIKIQKNNIYIIGDAATQVKATTSGGIIQGLLAAKCLYNCIVKDKNYKKEVRKTINNDLWLHLKIRNILDRFSLKDYDYLINLFNKKKNKGILEKYDRDYPSRFILKLAISEPRLLYFIKNLICRKSGIYKNP